MKHEAGSGSAHFLQRQAKMFRALADPTRLKLLHILKERGPLNVGEVTAILGVSQPTISHHFKYLTAVGLVQREVAGTFRVYRLREEISQQLAELLASGPYDQPRHAN